MTQEDFLQHVGIEIRVARIRRKMTGTQLCELADINNSTLTLIESGKQAAQLSTLYRICYVMGIDIKTLFP